MGAAALKLISGCGAMGIESAEIGSECAGKGESCPAVDHKSQGIFVGCK